MSKVGIWQLGEKPPNLKRLKTIKTKWHKTRFFWFIDKPRMIEINVSYWVIK